jgi:hypothetical protein
MPGSRERKLGERLKASEERCASLLANSAGVTTIAGLDARVASLEVDLKAKDKDICSLKARCDNLTDKNKKLKADNTALKKENRSLRWDVKVAHSEYAAIRRMLEKTEKKRYEWAQKARTLEDRCRLALAELAKLKTALNKNPANSSLPPSLCPNKKTVYNSRIKSGKRPGGQPGHVGHRRRRITPDKTVEVALPVSCPVCGGLLKALGEPKRRTLTEVVITTHTTEYSSFDCVCTACDERLSAPFPNGVVNEANYGDSVRAVVTTLVDSCNISIEKALGFLWEASGHTLKISAGSAHNFLASFATKAKGELGEIAQRISESPVVGTDATYTSASGKRTYVYVTHADRDALYQASPSKGIAPLEASPLKGYSGTVVHDHDISCYSYGKRHAECNAHILRYLKGVCETEPKKRWAPEMLSLLCEANDAAKAAGAKGLDDEEVGGFFGRYDAIVALAASEYAADLPVPAKYAPEGLALYRRLGRYRDAHLLFLRDPAVPFDNNASERLLRGVKQKTKQTGGFRSLDNGQANYCAFLSVTQSARARGMEVLGGGAPCLCRRDRVARCIRYLDCATRPLISADAQTQPKPPSGLHISLRQLYAMGCEW